MTEQVKENKLVEKWVHDSIAFLDRNKLETEDKVEQFIQIAIQTLKKELRYREAKTKFINPFKFTLEQVSHGFERVTGKDVLLKWQSYLRDDKLEDPEVAYQLDLEFGENTKERLFALQISNYPRFLESLTTILWDQFSSFLQEEERCSSESNNTGNTETSIEIRDVSMSLSNLYTQWSEFSSSTTFWFVIWREFVHLYDPSSELDEQSVQEDRIEEFFQSCNWEMEDAQGRYSNTKSGAFELISMQQLESVHFKNVGSRLLSFFYEAFVEKQSEDFMFTEIGRQPVCTNVQLVDAQMVSCVVLAGWIANRVSKNEEFNYECRKYLSRVLGLRWGVQSSEAWFKEHDIGEMICAATNNEVFEKAESLLRRKNKSGRFRPTHKMLSFYFELDRQIQQQLEVNNQQPTDSITDFSAKLKQVPILQEKYSDAVNSSIEIFQDSALQLQEGVRNAYHESGYDFLVWKWVKTRLYYSTKSGR